MVHPFGDKVTYCITVHRSYSATIILPLFQNRSFLVCHFAYRHAPLPHWHLLPVIRADVTSTTRLPNVHQSEPLTDSRCCSPTRHLSEKWIFLAAAGGQRKLPGRPHRTLGHESRTRSLQAPARAVFRCALSAS